MGDQPFEVRGNPAQRTFDVGRTLCIDIGTEYFDCGHAAHVGLRQAEGTLVFSVTKLEVLIRRDVGNQRRYVVGHHAQALLADAQGVFHFQACSNVIDAADVGRDLAVDHHRYCLERSPHHAAVWPAKPQDALVRLVLTDRLDPALDGGVLVVRMQGLQP